MNTLYLIQPEKPSSLLFKMIKHATKHFANINIVNYNNIPDLTNKKILFAVQLNKAGFSMNLSKILTELWKRGKHSLYDSTACVLVHCDDELYTKTTAQNIIFHANQLGCRFPGRPLVEATGSLRNLLTMQKVISGTLEDVCLKMCDDLGKRLKKDKPKLINSPQLLVLHSSNRETSNTLMLWDMIHSNLKNYNISEIHIENGTVLDCYGCPYKTCKHYGNQTSCFYGGIMVEEVYPAVLQADAVIWICPNYNDAISANLSAVINRLTALFRKTKFFNKTLFGVIVSGHSGSDAIAKQLISALNINKTFRLPPYFCIMATANDKNEIKNVKNIENKAKEFAENLSLQIKK